MLLTKHCSPQVREFMLDGKFKIGTHEEYSQGLQTGTLSDTAEGKGGFIVKGDLLNFSGFIGRDLLQNVTITNCGSGNSIMHENAVNTLMFCTSIGEYNKPRHSTILRGSHVRGYMPNPDYTAYVTLDCQKLGDALLDASEECFDVECTWFGMRVSYGQRHVRINAADFKGFTDAESMLRTVKQASLKPVSFAVEEEYRFLLGLHQPRPIPKCVYTKDLSERVQRAFQKALVGKGGIWAG